jgi:hypothetical protein
MQELAAGERAVPREAIGDAERCLTLACDPARPRRC